jgi:16S rRNA (guanine527-N7)-methyltransferase
MLHRVRFTLPFFDSFVNAAHESDRPRCNLDERVCIDVLFLELRDMHEAVPSSESQRQANILRVATAFGASGEGLVAKLSAYVGLVEAWNAKIDLTAARTPEELVDLLAADALFLAAHVRQGARVVDVGSGAGAPGLPLAIARPDLDVTLVEPLQKRVAFLRTVIGSLWQGRTTQPRVVRARGEELAKKGERFEAAISRATLPPPAWARLGAQLAEDEVWILLAREDAPEVPGRDVAEDVRYEWPLTGASRRAVKLVRGA